MLDRRASAWLFIPSVYGLGAWLVTLFLYSERWLDWHPSGEAAWPIFIGVIACFAVSAFTFHGPYGRALDGVVDSTTATAALPRRERPWHIADATLWSFHLVGLAGLGLYLREILDIFGGFGGLLSTLVAESHLIRGAETSLLWIYLSYFGWMAIPLTIVRWRSDGRPPWPLLAAALLQLAGNMLYIDRTRPVWLIFVSVLVVFPFVHGFALRRLALGIAALVAFGVAAFYAIGFWVGKVGEGFSYYGYVGVGQEAAILYYYLTSGFAYFEALLDTAPLVDYVPQRSLYPLFKLAAMAGLADDPPSQVLPFIDTPFPSNVGTFLEPLYSDGGMLFVWAGALFSAFGVDLFALWMLRSTNPYALVCWANFCFVSFISFFVPKLPSTPLWLFVFIAFVAGLVRKLKPRLVEDDLFTDRAVMANIGARLAVAGAPASAGPAPGVIDTPLPAFDPPVFAVAGRDAPAPAEVTRKEGIETPTRRRPGRRIASARASIRARNRRRAPRGR